MKYKTIDSLKFANNNSEARFNKTSFGLLRLEVETVQGEIDYLVVDDEELLLLRDLLVDLCKEA